MRLLYCMLCIIHSHSEDLAISGVAVGAEHMERALASLHSSHSDAIGAPKVGHLHMVHSL